MADNVTISAGVGTVIATDEVGDSSHVQLFKLAYAADGSRALVPADADGLTVKATALDLAITALRDAIVGAGPKTLTDIVTALGALTVSISGSVDVTGSVVGVTGTVAVSSSALPTLASTSTKQSDGSQKTQVVDGSGNVIGATSNALDINIKSGNPTTMVVTQPTGTNLHVVLDSGAVTATVTGSVTANAGTNLNTSLLALEAGGNLATLAGKDFATSALQTSGNASLTSLAAKDFATETTQALQATAANQVTEIAALGTLATEATLAALALAQESDASNAVGPMVQGVVNDSPPSYNDTVVRPLSLTSQGRLRVSAVEADVGRVWESMQDSPWLSTESPWEMENVYG